MKQTSREVRETVTLLYEPVQRSCEWFESYIIYGNHCWEHQKLLPGISDLFYFSRTDVKYVNSTPIRLDPISS